MFERLSAHNTDKAFIVAQRLGAGVLVAHDPGQLEPIDYPARTAEEDSMLAELAKLSHEARLAFDAEKS